jgi:hypothetical protein
VGVWERRSEAVRAGIVATVKAASKGGRETEAGSRWQYPLVPLPIIDHSQRPRYDESPPRRPSKCGRPVGGIDVRSPPSRRPALSAIRTDLRPRQLVARARHSDFEREAP